MQSKIEFTKELSAPRGAGDEAAVREAQLQAENKQLKKGLEELKSIEAALAPAPAPKAASTSDGAKAGAAVGGARPLRGVRRRTRRLRRVL